MAIGFDIVIPDKLITKLAQADKRLKTISQTSEETKNRVVRAFNQMTLGADEFLKKLQQINTEMGKLGNVKLQITTTNTTQSVDDINKLIQLTKELTDAQKKQLEAQARAELTKRAKSDAQETTKRQISEEQRLTAQIKAQNAELSAEYKRRSKENIAIADNEARKRIAANRLATNEIIAQMQRETRFRIQEANRIAKLTQTPNTISRKDVGRIIDVSRNATSINQMQTAIKNLEKAKRDLDTTDKKYDKTVKAINNEIARQQANLRKLGAEMDRVRQSTERARGITEQLRRSLMLMFSLSQISGYIKKLVAVRGEFELQKRSLEAILQNKDAANEIWDKTVQLAIKSPFQIKELVSYTKQLAAYRVESEKLHNTTKMLADVSAGLGVDMQRLILAYGQVKAANYLRGTELRQFSEAGINILGELATYFSEVENRAISVGEVFQMVSKRMVSFADVEEVFKRITSEGGTFYNMQEIQAETLKGQISNLRDSLDVILNDIGMSQEGVLKGAVRMARNLLNSWEEWGTWVIPVLTSFLAKWALVNIISKRNYAAITRVFVAFTSGFNKAGAAWTRFNAYAAIASAVAAAIWAIVNAIRAANKEARELSKIELTGIFEASKMDAEYKRLADTVSDVTKSYDEQKKALDTLKRTYDDILPKHLLEVQTIKEMAGNYDEATAAINNYMNAQIKQKQISYIDEDYTDKIIKESDDLTSDLFNKLKDRIGGLKRTDVATVINEFTRQLIDGQIAIGEYEVKLQELFDNYFGKGLVKTADFYEMIIQGTSGYGQAQTQIVSLLHGVTTASEEYLEKMNEIVNYKPRIGSGIVVELNNIKESYKQSAMDIEKYKKVISDKAKGSELVTDEQYQDAINNLNAIFEYAGKEAPNWAEIINEPFKLNQATIEANQSLWKKMIDGFKDMMSTEDLFGRFTWFNKEDKDSITKAIDDATKDVEKFAGSEFQKEVNRIAIYVQDKMNKSFIGLQGLLPKETESREEYAKRLEEKIKEMEAGIAQQKIDLAKGGDLMDDELAKQYEEQLPLLKEFYSYFYHKDEESGKSNKIFEERLRILREMYDSYKDLNKTFDATKSIEGVDDKYRQAFKDAFGFDFDVWGNFFTNEDDYKEALQKLKVMTKDAKDQLKVEIEKGRITWDMEVKLKTDQDKDLKNELQSYFDQYDMGLELDKLGVSGDAAYSLFGVESMDLDKLRSVVDQFKDQFIGTDMEDEYKVFQDKLTEMEVKAQQERLKKYLGNIRDNISDRAKLKIEELQKLKEIEDSFVAKEGVSEEEKQAIETAKKLAVEGLKESTKQQLQKMDWEDFQKSDYFISMFDDLDSASSMAIKSMITQLENYKEQWTDMPLDDMQKVIDLINKLKDAADEKITNPFYAAKKTEREIAEYGRNKSESESDFETFTNFSNYAEEQARLYEQALIAKTKILTVEEQEQMLGKENMHLLSMSSEELSQQRDYHKALSKDYKNQASLAQQQLQRYAKLTNQYEKQAQVLADIRGTFNNLVGAATELGEALGMDEMSKMWTEIGGNVFDTGLAIAEGVLGLKAQKLELDENATAAEMFGYKMNMALGIIGYIVMAIQLVAKVITAIAKAHDNNLQKQIECDAEAVELLQKRFEKLEEAIDNAMSFGQYQKEFDEAKRNLEEQIRLTEDMIALEEAKKKTDKDAIKGYKDEIEDYNEQLKEMEEKRIEDMGGFGGQDAIKDAAEGFIDAWADAYNETGDGLDALKDKWDEYFQNLLKKQMMMKVASKYMGKVLEEINNAISDDILTGEEMEKLKTIRDESSEQLNAIMKQLAEQMSWEGGLGGGSELEGLSESIQGVTEVTAQALEAILNSMRFYVIDNNTQQKRLVEIMESWETPTSPILAELKRQTGYLLSIESLFNSVIDRSGSPAVRIR